MWYKPKNITLLIFWLIIPCIVVACNYGSNPTQIPKPTSFPSSTPILENPPISGAIQNTSVPSDCAIGTGLREEVIPILLEYKDYPAFMQASTIRLASTYFPQFEGWIRTIGAPSLEELESKALLAAQEKIPYEALGYGLETGKSTPESEWQNMIHSTQQAREMADRYGKLLVMGPGYKLMSDNEEKYAQMSALSDIWIFQTQRFQVNPPGQQYRQDVIRVIDLIKEGNPDIKIWAQITLPPDREPDAVEWLAYRNSISDLVDGVYLGVYLWERVDTTTLIQTINTIYTNCNSK